MSMFMDVVKGMSAGEAMAKEIAELRRQLDAVTAERDHLRKALELADALRNHQVQKLERREWRRT